MTASEGPRPFHRLAGLLLAFPLLLWMASGLLFHVKHRYAEAYEALAVPPPVPPLWDRVVFSPAAFYARGYFDPGTPLALAPHPRGLVAFYGRLGAEPVAADGISGDRIPLGTEEAARIWAERAVAASKHAARYGSIRKVEPAAHRSPLTGLDDPAFTFLFSGGKRVTVDRVTGEVTQTGALNDWIDLTYRLHYLQWTPWKPVNAALVLLAAPLVLFLATSGVRMAFAKGDS